MTFDHPGTGSGKSGWGLLAAGICSVRLRAVEEEEGAPWHRDVHSLHRSLFPPRPTNQATDSRRICTADHLASSSQTVYLFFWQPIHNVLRFAFVLLHISRVSTERCRPTRWPLGWSTSMPCPAGPVRMSTLALSQEGVPLLKCSGCD